MNRKLESQEIYGSVSIVILKRGQVMSIKDYRIHKWNVNLKIQARSPTDIYNYIKNFQVQNRQGARDPLGVIFLTFVLYYISLMFR